MKITKQILREAVKNKEISVSDIQDIVVEFSPKAPQSNSNILNISRIFALLGGLTVFIGYMFLLGLYWEDFNSPIKIITTLGVGVITFIAAHIGITRSSNTLFGLSLHIPAGLLIPTGIFVTLNQLPEGDLSLSLLFGLVFSILGIGYSWYESRIRQPLIVLLTIVYSSIAYISFATYLEQFILPLYERYAWLTLIPLGASYLVLSSFLEDKTHPRVSRILLGLGGLVILTGTAGISIQTPFELGLLLVIAAMYYLSTRVNSVSIVTWATIFFIGHVFWINTYYFADVISFPIALIFSGILMIIISLGAVQFSKRFITPSSSLTKPTA